MRGTITSVGALGFLVALAGVGQAYGQCGGGGYYPPCYSPPCYSPPCYYPPPPCGYSRYVPYPRPVVGIRPVRVYGGPGARIGGGPAVGGGPGIGGGPGFGGPQFDGPAIEQPVGPVGAQGGPVGGGPAFGGPQFDGPQPAGPGGPQGGQPGGQGVVEPGSAPQGGQGPQATFTDNGRKTDGADQGQVPPPPPPPLAKATAKATLGRQKTCPVTGEELGTMGTPIPVTVKGQLIYVCCQGCVEKVKASPDQFLAKVAAERGGALPAAPAQLATPPAPPVQTEGVPAGEQPR